MEQAVDVPRPPSYYNDLEASLSRSWELLSRGAVDRQFSFHTPTVATIGLDGMPRVRTVVLRAVDSARRTLRFHTDVRSAKFAELAADPRCAIHVYDRGQKVQLRVTGRARLLHDCTIARMSWDQSRPQSQECYRQTPGPGTPLTAPGDAVAPTEAQAGDGLQNFVVVEVWIEALEWLYLAHFGHRRASFSWNANGELFARWLAP